MATLDLNKALRAVKTVINRGDGTGFPLAAKRQIRNALDVLAGKSGAPGSGITAGTGTVVKTSVQRAGELIHTKIYIDLTGLESEATLADIIGDDAAANCHFGQILSEVNGTVVAGKVTCLETPAGGEVDIDLYSANESTGVEGAAVTALTETAVLESGIDWTTGTALGITLTPPDRDFLYLSVGTAATPTAGTYTAGKFLIELFGTA